MRRYLPVLLVLSFVIALPASAEAATFKPIGAAKFKLVRSGLDQAAYNGLAGFERSYPRVGVGTVIGDANRAVRPLGDSSAVRGIAGLAGGFRWNKGDDDVSYWYPQGITGSGDATGGTVAGRRILLVSWYSNNGKGSRVSFVNVDRLATARYRHVLLVKPTSNTTFDLVKVHAGGIAWYGNLLYVADTDNGIRVFDTSHLVRAHGAQSLGYKYLLPQVGAYRSSGAKLRYSFVSVDRGSKSLLAGEYRDGKTGGRLVRWKLANNGRIARTAFAAYRAPERNMQGALSLGGRLFASASRGASPGVLTSGKPRKTASSARWAISPEDLTYAPGSKRIYSLTERKGLRTVFAIRR